MSEMKKHTVLIADMTLPKKKYKLKNTNKAYIQWEAKRKLKMGLMKKLKWAVKQCHAA